MSEKKVSEQDLASLQELQQTFDALVSQYGELHLKRRIIDSDIQRCEDAFNELEASRQEIGLRVQEQFGSEGTVNLVTGEFVPA
jgi:chaperonin cofactor prefoldin